MILVVDDEQPFREALERTLRSAGYDVVAVADATEAIAFLGRETPQAVLLDINLGTLSGWAVAGFMKTVDRLKSVQVVIISGLDPDTIRQGAQQYVNTLSHAAVICSKPFDKNMLLAILRNL